jgi:CheY-like chemotaxis protein
MPVIALTANAVSGAREMFMENGFDGLLSKPIDAGALAEILLRWLPEELIIRQ